MHTRDISFGALVKQYIETHELSYQDLVEKLGYKSKTSVARIVQDTTSYDLRHDFYKRFSKCFSMTSEEKKAFQALLDLSRLTSDQQALFLTYRRFFSLKQTNDTVYCISGQNNAACTLDALLQDRIQDAGSIRILLFGYCSSSALLQLYRILNEAGVKFTIHHFLYPQHDPSCFIQFLSDVISFLFDKRYTIHYADQNDETTRIENLYLLHYDLKDGTEQDDLLLQLDHDHLLHQPQENGRAFSAIMRLTDHLHATVLNEHYSVQNVHDGLANWINHQRKHLQVEENRALYSYSDDISMTFIPPAIFQKAILPELTSDAMLRPHLQELCFLQQKCYQTMHTKRSPSYFIFTRSTLKDFLWTGTCKAHPVFLRPFSPEERFEILNDMLLCLSENPFFFVRVAADDIPQLWSIANVCCFRQMARASSHGSLANKDALILHSAIHEPDEECALCLSDPMLISTFATFYLDEIWKQHTLSPRRSLDIINNLIRHHAIHFSK